MRLLIDEEDYGEDEWVERWNEWMDRKVGGLNEKCGDGVEMMIVKNIPSSSSFFFFFEGEYVGNTSKWSWH